MSGTNQEDAVLEAEEAARAAADASGDVLGADGGGDNESGDDAGEAERRSRPGRLERRLQRTQRELDDERRMRSEEAARVQALERQLAEARDAGNRMAQHSLQAEMRQAQDALRQAHVSNDTEALVAAQTRMSQLAAAGQVMAQQPAAPARAAVAAAPQQRFTASTTAWMQANPWYGTDAALTSLARAVHDQAMRQNLAVDTPAYWDFVNRGVEAVAPGTVKGARDPDDDDAHGGRLAAAGARQVSGDGPVARAPARTPPSPRGGAEVRLTAEEADAAKVCGMTPQEYKQWQTKLKAAGRIGRGS